MTSIPLRWRLLLLALIWALALTFAARQDWHLWNAPPDKAATALVQPDAAVWFTVPQSAQTYRGGPAAELVNAVEQARLSIDLATYSLDLWPLRDALIAAQRRGVRVRLVLEADNADVPEVLALQQAGIPLHTDTNPALMHHKFVILDGEEVWSGSMNLTVESAYHDNNNLLRLHNPQVVADFQREFDEMFTAGRFGSASLPDTPFPTFTLAEGRGEVYFSPDDGVLANILETVDGAQQEICLLAFSFTSDALGDLLLKKAEAGVRVQGVFDEGQARSNRGSEYGRLRAAGLNVRLDGNPGLMHHKVIVIDGETVITGSYNFSASAEKRNDENLLILHHPALAAAYQAECEQLVAQGK